jgi:probable addiction module antidote protein
VALETTLWDPAKRLSTPEAVRAYLEAALEDGDPAVIAAALDDIARAEREGPMAASRMTPARVQNPGA